jgi:hypothetical protein
VAADCVVTFAVTGGIFGVGQLATRLNKLLESKFDSVEDGKLSEYVVRLDLEGARS